MKRESFALKISILNNDEYTFKFLWDQSNFWNMGHFMICLEYIIKSSWEDGLNILLASTTSKIIFMSVHNSDFIIVIEHLRELLA